MTTNPRGEFARIEDQPWMDLLSVHLGVQGPDVRMLFGPGGKAEHVIAAGDFDTPADYRPALQVTPSMARELLRALLAHFGDAQDTRALRRDYDAERDRVDKLTDAVIVIADRVTDRTNGA